LHILFRIEMLSVMRRLLLMNFFFFFSSRRRHTRSYGDWSSDVCSSDLGGRLSAVFSAYPFTLAGRILAFAPLTRPHRGVFVAPRSEERRVGKECSSRRSPDH